MLITSQAPGGKQRYTAPASAQPASSDISPEIIERFVAWQQVGITELRRLSAADARRVMVSPFVTQVTYSVLDGYRLIAAHQRRHLEQAKRVIVVALALTRVMSALLFGIGPMDPMTYASVSAALAAAGLLATYLPARRASRVDPVVALHADD